MEGPLASWTGDALSALPGLSGLPMLMLWPALKIPGLERARGGQRPLVGRSGYAQGPAQAALVI